MGGGTRFLGLLAAMVVVAGCPASKPPIRVVTVPEPDDETEGDAVGRLRFVDHWAACVVGPNGPREAVVTDADGVGEARVLPPGAAVAVPAPDGPFQAGVRRVGEDAVAWSFEHLLSGPVPRTPGPASPWPIVEAGCSPHTLRQRHLAAVVLVSVGMGPESLSRKVFGAAVDAFDGDVRLGGLTVRVRPGERTTVFLPRGSHALKARPAVAAPGDGCNSMEALLDAPLRLLDAANGFEGRLELEGAGAVIGVGRCGFVASLRL